MNVVYAVVTAKVAVTEIQLAGKRFTTRLLRQIEIEDPPRPYNVKFIAYCRWSENSVEHERSGYHWRTVLYRNDAGDLRRFVHYDELDPPLPAGLKQIFVH